MARYVLPAAQSMYRDTGAVEMTKMFRDRYLQNIAADDALAQAVLEMQSLDQDDETKKSLIETYNTKLKQRADQGNYEMKGRAIQKDARSFMNDYNPIKTSVERYNAYAAGVEKDYQGGKIDAETRNGKLNEALYNYKGVQYNLDGSVNDESLFNGVSYVHDVNVEEEIIKQMKDVVMTEIDTTGMEYALDGQGNEIKIEKGEEGDPSYYMKYGTYTKKLDEGLVASVVSSVLNNANVDAAITQKAHLENYFKGEINTDTNKSLAAEQLDKALTILGGQIDKLEGTKKTAEKAQLAFLESQESAILEALDLGMSEVDILTSLSYDSKRAMYRDAAITKYAGVKSRKTVRDYTESSSLKAKNSNAGSALPTIKYNVGVDGLVVEPLGGNTVSSKQAKYTASVDVLQGYITEKGEDFVKTASDATTAEAYDLIASKYKITNREARRMAKDIRYHQAQTQLIELKLEEAFISEHKMSSQAYGEMIAKGASNLNASYDDITYLEGQKFNLDMNSLKAAFDQLGRTGLGPGEMINELNNNPELKKQVINSIATQNFKSANMEDVDPVVLETPELAEGIKNDFVNETTQGLDNMISSHMAKVDDGKAKINKFLKDEEIKTDAVVMTSFNDPTGKTTKAVQTFLKEGLPNSKDFKLIDQNNNPTTYQALVDKKDGFWSKDTPPTIVKEQVGLVHISRPDGMALIAIPFKSEDGEIETYYADASQFSIASVDEYTNDMMFQLRTLYRAGVWTNIKGKWSPDVFEGTVTFDYAREKIIINGIDHGIDGGLDVIKGSLVKNNQDI
tara:strand:+ start:35 stop:2419 length:2385 start_codon:yes stop_codon:yes gene_type:complete